MGQRWGGFTLIELLVVVAIIALLISILLPSLGGAREQAKTIKCLSNLKQIGNAMVMYFQDNNNWFPFGKRNGSGLHGFYYGGHPGREYWEGEEWWGYVNVQYRDTPAGRAFNRYIYPNLADYDVPPEDPQFEMVRDMPVFECPSDTGGVWNNAPGEDTHGPNNLYWQVGSSYDCNYHFVVNWAMEKDPNRYLHYANALLRMQLRFYAPTFIIIYEDPFDSAQWQYIPRRGWHKKWNTHDFLFLDGHAANMKTDTTKGASGPGWKSCSGQPGSQKAWWINWFDPDYQYRDITALPGE